MQERTHHAHGLIRIEVPPAVEGGPADRPELRRRRTRKHRRTRHPAGRHIIRQRRRLLLLQPTYVFRPLFCCETKGIHGNKIGYKNRKEQNALHDIAAMQCNAAVEICASQISQS